MASTLSQRAYQTIRQNLLDPSFTAGNKISETRLARQLGISRTPVREAIRRLESEGLLYQVPCSGTFLAQPDRRQVIETYEVREALECMTIVRATKRMTAKERAQLQSMCDKMRAAITMMRDAGAEILEGKPLQQYLTADLAFHLMLLRAAKNRMAMKIVADSRVRDSVFGHHSHRRTLHHVAWVWLVHARIARAVRRYDASSARYWMKQHLRTSRRDALAAFDDQLSARISEHGGPVDLTESLGDMVQQLMEPERRSKQH